MRVAEPDEAFWDLWNTDNATLRNAGIFLGFCNGHLASGMVDYLLPDSIPNCGYFTHQSMDLPDHRLTPGASALTPAGDAS